jgi:GAF domain-containing protein
LAQSFTVSNRGAQAVQVVGVNWIVALGAGLEALGVGIDITRLACEVLANGTVIAMDIKSGNRYVVQPADAATDEPDGRIEDEDADDDDSVLALPAEAIGEFEPEDHRELIHGAETMLMASQLAMNLCVEAVPSESGAVILEERGLLRFVAVHGPQARRLIGVRLPPGTGVAGFAMEKRRPVVVRDAHRDPRHCGEVDDLTGYVTKAIVVVPLVGADKVHGVLELMNPPYGGYTTEQIARVEEVARHLAERLDR